MRRISRTVQKCFMLALSTGAILAPSNPWAGTGHDDDALGRFILPGINGFSRHERVTVAEAFRKEFLGLQNAMPPLSPREEDWLKSELERIGQLETVEYMRQMFLYRQKPEVARDDGIRFLATQLEWINVITNDSTPEAEISAWAGLASTLLESLPYEQIVLVVQSESIVPPKGHFNDKVKEGGEMLGFTRELLAKKILEQIVVPNTAPPAVQQAYKALKNTKQ